MKLTYDELAFLAAWAREEWELACYELPAHRLQLANGRRWCPLDHTHQALDRQRRQEGSRDFGGRCQRRTPLALVHARRLRGSTARSKRAVST